MIALWRNLSPGLVYRAPGWIFGDLWRGLATLRGRSTFYDSTPLRQLIRRELPISTIRSSVCQRVPRAWAAWARDISRSGVSASSVFMVISSSAMPCDQRSALRGRVNTAGSLGSDALGG